MVHCFNSQLLQRQGGSTSWWNLNFLANFKVELTRNCSLPIPCMCKASINNTCMYVFGKKGCVVSRLGILPSVQWPIIPLKKFIIPISISLKDERVMAICMLATEIDILTNSIDTQKCKKIARVGHISEIHIILEPRTWNSTTRFILTRVVNTKKTKELWQFAC